MENTAALLLYVFMCIGRHERGQETSCFSFGNRREKPLPFLSPLLVFFPDSVNRMKGKGSSVTILLVYKLL